MIIMPKLIEMVGKKFNKLTVLRDSGFRGARNRIKYVCLCECGNETLVFGDPLRSGHTKSCGCDRIAAITKHGAYGCGAYKSWDKMIQRCTNPNNHAFRHYGGSGVRVCKEWLDFSNFYRDMGDRPEGMTIERINSEDGYNPKNCKWATKTEQMNNTSRNIAVSIASKLMTVKEIADEMGKSYSYVNNTLWKNAVRLNKCYIVSEELRLKFFKEIE